MFKKMLWSTDWHFGRKNSDPVSLEDNMQFIDWMIAEGKSNGCDAFVFGGDFFDSRSSINVLTLHKALEAFEKINAAFPNSFIIKGNHDLFMKESRAISSVEIARNFKNINIIDHPMTISDVTFLPWLVGDEKRTKLAKSRYIFGHLELPGFLMNAKVELPLTSHSTDLDLFDGNEYVFTGHFHLRQQKKNIIYTGAAMPYSFSDNWDDERGIMILEYGGTPQFKAWPNQPLFRTMKLSEMLDKPDSFLTEKLTARIALDIDISYEEAQVIKETFVDDYKLRRIELVPQQKIEASQSFAEGVVFQSVDQIVVDGLMSIESSGMKPTMLVDIYRSL